MSFDAQEIQFQIFAPNLQNPITEPLFVTVGDGIEIFDGDFNVPQGTLVEHSFDVTSDSLLYQVSPSTGFRSFGSANFNGYVISDVFDVLPAIENVTIDFSGTTLGINSEYISFNEDQIFFNVESLPFSPGDTVKLDVDFASQVGGVISGTKWNDRNGNGSRNNNDPGLSGVQIYLDTNNNGILDANEPVTVTDQSGNYEFTGLEPGTYIVREVIPQGFRQTFPLGSETNSVGDGFADVILDYFNSGTGTFDEPYGSDNQGNFPVLVNTDIILGSDENGALSLPTGSFVTVGFTDEIIVDNPGDDIFVPEVGLAGEQAEVFVSSDGENFVLLGIGNGGVTSSFDLADINFTEPVRAVRILGLDNGGGSPGFDVINVQGLPGSIASSDFYTIDLTENEVVENIDFGNFLDDTLEPQLNGFFGSDIQLGIFSPNLNSPLREPRIATVTDAIEFDDDPLALSSSNSIVGLTVDISEDSIFYTVGETLGTGTFTSATFNGFVFTDIFDTAPGIENVTIDFSETTLGVNSADVSFTEDEVFLNVEGIPFTPGDTVKLDVTFDF